MPAIPKVSALLVLVLTAVAQAQEPAPSQPDAFSLPTAPAEAAGPTTGTALEAPPPLVTEPPASGSVTGEPDAAPAPLEAAGRGWEEPVWWLAIPAWLLVLIGLGLALYTARLWKATRAALEDARDTTRKELRAYVALDEMFFSEPTDSGNGVQKLRLRNYGQTPAARLSIWCERASHLPQDGVKPFYDAPVLDGQLLHPVQGYTLGLAPAPLYRTAKPGFFTYGRIVYCDIYGRWWVTRFCHRYEGEGSFVPYGDYNSEDGPFDTPPA